MSIHSKAITSVLWIMFICSTAVAREITLTLTDAPLTVNKGQTVTKKINGIPSGMPGSIDLEVKWHAMTLIPNVFEKLKIEVLHGSSVVVTKQCYSIHADKEPKCYLFPMTSSNTVEFTRTGDWKLRVTNDSNNDVNGFNIQKEGTDLNPNVPGFVSTFEANCSVRDLSLSTAPLDFAPHASVDRELFGAVSGVGEFRIRAKWHVDVITPNVFSRMKVELLYNGSVVATDFGYSIHSNEKDKLDLRFTTEGSDPLKWKLRISNEDGYNIKGFDVEKGRDANPFVPQFKSTFQPCN